MRPGGDRGANLQRLDLRRIEPARVVGIGPLADRQQRDPLTVDGHLEVVRLDAQRPVRQDLEDVLRVLGEVVVDHHSAAGAERQPLHAAVLAQVGGDAEGLGRRRRHRRRHRESADLARRRQVALHQRRRDAEDAGDVVEAVARVVGRQQLADVDVERQQIAHRVAVLRPAQAVERLRAPGIGIGRGGVVELALEPGAELRVGSGLRARPRTGRHRPGAQLADDLLPDLGVRGHVGHVDRARGQRQAARSQPVVVARDAVAVEQGALPGSRLRAGRLDGWRSGGLPLRGRTGRAGGDQPPRADEETGQHPGPDTKPHAVHRTLALARTARPGARRAGTDSTPTQIAQGPVPSTERAPGPPFVAAAARSRSGPLGAQPSPSGARAAYGAGS